MQLLPQELPDEAPQATPEENGAHDSSAMELLQRFLATRRELDAEKARREQLEQQLAARGPEAADLARALKAADGQIEKLRASLARKAQRLDDKKQQLEKYRESIAAGRQRRRHCRRSSGRRGARSLSWRARARRWMRS